MRYFIFIILSFFILKPFVVSGQKIDIKKLENVLKTKNEKEKIKLIKDSVIKYGNHHLNKRLEFSRIYLKEAKKSKNKKYIADAYYTLGYSYEIIGQNDLAIKACYKALEYFDELNDTNMMAFTYNEIGLIYSSGFNELEQQLALKYFKKFLHLQTILNDTAEIAGAYSNIGLVYIYSNKLDSALYYSKLALKLRKQINQRHTIPISLGNMGQIYLDLNKPDSAIFYFKEGEKIHSELNNIYGLFEMYGGMISYYVEIGDSGKAWFYANKRLELANKINSKHTKRLAYLSMSIYYESIKDYNKSLEYYKDYKIMSDSVRSSRIKNKVANLEAVYELDKKEKQIELFKEKENSRKQRSVFMVVLSILMISFLAFLIASISRKRKNEIILHEIEKQNHLKEKRLSEIELEKSKLKENELNTKLEYNSKQLTSHALNMMKTNQLLNELEKDIYEIKKKSDDTIKPQLKRLITLIKINKRSKKDWDLFKKYFEEVNQGFYNRLKTIGSGLSSNDYKICALIKLNMNIKESADVLNISPESVKTARYRLRKKLNLGHNDNLYEFMQNV